MEDQKAEQEKPKQPINPLLDEVRAERQALEKARDEAKAQADRLEQLRADHLLSGTGGIRDITPALTVEEAKLKAAQDLANEISGAFKRR